jgi:hypothetical protein
MTAEAVQNARVALSETFKGSRCQLRRESSRELSLSVDRTESTGIDFDSPRSPGKNPVESSAKSISKITYLSSVKLNQPGIEFDSVFLAQKTPSRDRVSGSQSGLSVVGEAESTQN